MSPRGKRRVASSHEEPPYGERLATLEAEFKHLASKEDVLRTQLWFYASIVSGAGCRSVLDPHRNPGLVAAPSRLSPAPQVNSDTAPSAPGWNSRGRCSSIPQNPMSMRPHALAPAFVVIVGLAVPPATAAVSAPPGAQGATSTPADDPRPRRRRPAAGRGRDPRPARRGTRGRRPAGRRRDRPRVGDAPRRRGDGGAAARGGGRPGRRQRPRRDPADARGRERQRPDGRAASRGGGPTRTSPAPPAAPP